MRGAGHFTPLYFPFLFLSFWFLFFPYCVFILLPSSRGAEKLLLLLLLSDVFDKSGFQRGESIRQTGEDNFCIAELLSYLCLSCGMELNNSQLSCPHAPCKKLTPCQDLPVCLHLVWMAPWFQDLSPLQSTGCSVGGRIAELLIGKKRDEQVKNPLCS